MLMLNRHTCCLLKGAPHLLCTVWQAHASAQEVHQSCKKQLPAMLVGAAPRVYHLMHHEACTSSMALAEYLTK